MFYVIPNPGPMPRVVPSREDLLPRTMAYELVEADSVEEALEKGRAIWPNAYTAELHDPNIHGGPDFNAEFKNPQIKESPAAHLFCLSGDEWGCSACGDVKHIDTLEEHRFPKFCDECGAAFDAPEFKSRARYGCFYSPAERAIVRLSRSPSKRTNAGCCPDCGSPVEAVRGGPSPHVKQCPVCMSYYRGVKVERDDKKETR